MIQLSRWKVILVVVAAVLGCLLAFPNLLSDQQREALPGFMPKNKLNLGLDLQGGSYLLLEVDVPAMREKRVTNLIEDVRVTLNGAGVATNGFQREAGGVVVTLANPAQGDAAFKALRHVGGYGARCERCAHLRRCFDTVHAKAAPIFARRVPGQQVPAAAVVGQAQRLDLAPARFARVVAVAEGKLSEVAAGRGQRLQQIRLHQRRGVTQGQGDGMQGARPPAQARGHHLVQLAQQPQRGVFDATDVGTGRTQRQRQGHRFLVVEHQRRQVGAAAQRVPTADAGRGFHRVAEFAQSVDVATHRARIDAQLIGKRRAGPMPPRLQQAGQAQQAGGGRQHAGSLSRTEDVRNWG